MGDWILCVSGAKSIPRAPCWPFTCATELALGTEPSQGLSCALSRLGWGWNGFHTVLQAWSTQYSSAHLRCTLAGSTGFFLAAGIKITVTPPLGCLKRPLALWWSHCKAALLVNSVYKLIQQCECGCKQVLQFLKYLFMSKIKLDKMHTR